MKNRAVKLIICVVLISCLMVGFCTTSHAVVSELLGGAALLNGALASVGVDLAVSAGVGYIGYELLNDWINGGYSIKGILTGVADGYIKVNNDSVTIDGTEYQSIFLSPEMAAQLHTQAFDFITQNAISSNDAGILAEGAGFVNGVPMYDTGGEYLVSQKYTVSFPLPVNSNYVLGDNYQVGNFIFQTANKLQTNVYRAAISLTPNNYTNAGYNSQSYVAQGEVLVGHNGGYRLLSGVNGTSSISNVYPLVEESFEFDYVSGTIDATPLTQDEGFQVFVPSAALQQAGIIVGTYPVDGGTGTDAILELIDLLDTIDPTQLLNPEFTETIDPPVPPTPVPTMALSDVPYDTFIDTFGQSITDGLEDVNDTIGLYGEEIIDTVDTVGQSITDELGNVSDTVDTVGQSIVDELETVEGVIDTVGQSIETALDTAADAVIEAVDSLAATIDEVIEAIMTHPLDLFSNFLDRLANIPIIKSTFDNFKQHVGIWHYVVEWLTCVGTFLGFMIGVFSDTAYCMVVPIYACVAAAICLAFYKRFGR